MKREGVRIIEADGTVTFENGVTGIRFDLKKGTWSAGKCGEEPVLKDAYAAAGAWKSNGEGMTCCWTTEEISDRLGTGRMLRIDSLDQSGSGVLVGFILYEGEAFLALCCGCRNHSGQTVRLKELSPLAGGSAFRGSEGLKRAKLLDGNSGAFETRVQEGGSLKSRNNALFTFSEGRSMGSVVLGGLTYTEFAKYAELEVRSEEKEDYALLKLCARDPYGKRVDDGQEYFPRGDLFYLDLYTEDPFHSLEVYGKRLALAQKAEPNLHSFPSVCLWYAEFYDMMNVSGEKLNTSGGAVREMESIRNSGFLKYAPAAVRLVPDYYGQDHNGGNTQQGWWDDEHWRRYQDEKEGNGRYTAPYETTAKWAGAVNDLGGIPLTYFQTSAVSEDYVKQYPEHTLFNEGNCRKGEFLNGAYQSTIGYDFTDPGFQEHMREVYRNLREGGVRGLMFDYPGTAWDEEGGFEDDYATTALNYINAFRLAKEGMGKDSYIDERGIETGLDVTLGWVDSQRTEDDTADMPPEMISKIGLRWYKNRVVTNYDMDSKDLMRAQSADELHTLVTMAYAVSGRLLLANGFENLSKEAVDALSRIYPQHKERKSFRPADAFLGKLWPEVYDYEVEKDWHQVILYNGDRLQDKMIEAPLSGDAFSGGLGLEPEAEYHVYDFWNDTYVGKLEGTQTLRQRVRRGESRMLSVRKVTGHPQVISSSRHVMQGAVELQNVRWESYEADGEAGILSGICELPAGEACRIEVKLPDGREYQNLKLEAEGEYPCEEVRGRLHLDAFENRVTLTLQGQNNMKVSWKLIIPCSVPANAECPEAPKDVRGLWEEKNCSLLLKWEGQERCLYRIYGSTDEECCADSRNLLAETENPWFRDENIRNHSCRNYKITAQNVSGSESDAASFSWKADFQEPVSFMGIDRTTGGEWKGIYGQAGCSLRGEGKEENLPPYIEEIRTNGREKTAAEGAVKTDSNLVHYPVKGDGKHLGYDSNSGVLQYEIRVSDKKEHLASFYCVDNTPRQFGSTARCRKMSLELKLPDGRRIQDAVPVTEFADGVFLKVKFRGSFILALRNMVSIGVFDSVCSGIFFDEF